MRLKKFNEKYDLLGDQYDFISEMDKINVEINNDQIEIEDIDWVDIMSCSVYWKHEIDQNKFGIDGIIPTVVKVTLRIDVYTYNEEKDIDESKEAEFEFDLYNTDFKEEYRDFDGKQILPFYPREIEFVKMSGTKKDPAKITISFNE